MTPPAAATKPHPARPARSRTAQRPPRRVSGPAGGRRAGTRPVAPPTRGGAVTVAPPLALRLARAAARIGDARFLDRLVRGRAWIALVAIGLMGIVFMQVSMLRLNAGISRAVTSAETLNRQNASLRGEISKLDSGERIADSAGALGMSLPPAGSVNYLDARKANGREAARGIHPPKPVKTAAATTTGASATAAQTPAQTTPQAPAAAAPAATQTQQAQPQAQAATAPEPTTPQQTVPQATSPAPAQTTQAQPAPQQQTATQAAPATTQPQTQAPAQQQEQQGPAQPLAQPPVTPAGDGTTGQGGQ
jgi:cell division protein FtsL